MRVSSYRRCRGVGNGGLPTGNGFVRRFWWLGIQLAARPTARDTARSARVLPVAPNASPDERHGDDGFDVRRNCLAGSASMGMV
jgi:hypothetical protein